MDERRLTVFLHTRAFTLLLMVVAFVASIIASNHDAIIAFTGNRGFIFPSANEWFESRGLSMVVSLLVTFGMASLAGSILKAFNTMRALSSLWASFFIVLECALPSVIFQFNSGTLLAVILIGATMILFSCYGVPDAKRVFLAFMLISIGSMFQYAYLFFIPVMILGLAQMRIIHVKPILAAFLGICAPYWFIFGCGILPLDSLLHPQFVHVELHLADMEKVRVYTVIGFTITIGIGFLIANLMKMLTYNAQVRAFNGIFAIMLIATALMLLIDYHNRSTYIPLLNFLTAYQICFFFTIRRFKRSYIPILAIVGLYTFLYVWSLIV